MNASDLLVCTGCGARLQHEDEDAPGYVPVSALQRIDPLCRRCFRMRHYGEFTRVVVPPDEYERLVGRVLTQPALILYVLDVFDLDGSLIPGFARLAKRHPVVLVVNKADLMPLSVKLAATEDWILYRVARTGVHPERVLFVSARTGQGFAELTEEMERHGLGRVCVVGMANVGKSSLLNRLTRRLAGDEPFTASRVPGTTLGTVAVEVTLPSGREVHLIDTPGLIHGKRIIDILCPACLRRAVPASRLRPRVYQLNPGQSLWLGGFARFDFEEGTFQPVTCYVSNDLVVHRTKLERAEAFGKAHADDILQAPCPACRSALGEHRPVPVVAGRFLRAGHAEEKALAVGRRGNDLVLPGLGWLALFGKDLRGKLWVPADWDVIIRRRFVGDVSRPRS
ncbi:GTPase [Alicyclobacillus cellulosilyticus]|uniref:GTPase n=1 Tax=Alicyclobacillus cellulosilyticus TaxID=1003997 RepID=UPI001E3ADF6B|nr:GTPase [Alicyclobacillus cellulosilyticus]